MTHRHYSLVPLYKIDWFQKKRIKTTPLLHYGLPTIKNLITIGCPDFAFPPIMNAPKHPNPHKNLMVTHRANQTLPHIHMNFMMNRLHSIQVPKL